MTTRAHLLVERLGRDAALRLIAVAGGTNLRVPGRLGAAAPLKDRIGADLATLVVLHFGDTRLSVPLSLDGRAGGRRVPVDIDRVAQLVARGWTSETIARELGCSERTITAKRAKLRSRARQADQDRGKDGERRP